MTIKAILFDFMGTCLDWHSSIIAALPASMTAKDRSDFALEWRQAYFDACTLRRTSLQPVEDIDITHLITLHTLLSSPNWSRTKELFTPAVQQSLIAAWHAQPAWDDVRPALAALRNLNLKVDEGGKEKGLELFVHANGTTRLQLDLVKSSGLKFDMLFSSQMLGVYKPARESYEAVMGLLDVKPDECVVVAAHNDDLRGAKAVGMKTVYIHRWTDDVLWDQEVVKKENDAWLGGMEGLAEVIEEFMG